MVSQPPSPPLSSSLSHHPSSIQSFSLLRNKQTKKGIKKTNKAIKQKAQSNKQNEEEKKKNKEHKKHTNI